MRRIAAALTLGFALIAPAPPAAAQGFALGFKGGINLASVSLEPEDGIDTGTRTGFVGGAFLTFRFTDALAVQPEVLFTQKGATIEVTDVDDGEDIEAELRIDYVEAPILLRVDLPLRTRTRPYVLAGPAFAFRTSCEVEAFGLEEDCDEEFEDNDLGIAFGAGVNFTLLRTALFLEGRYTLGTEDIDEDDDFETENRVWSILAGFSFPLLGR